ncbi:MAG: hypothetical protein AAFX65_07475 [Cyanobacteria bacterium J06638_7]
MAARVYPDSKIIVDGNEVVNPERIVGLLVWVQGTKFHVYDDLIGLNTWRAEGRTFELCE